MTVKLTPDVLRQAYDLLAETEPFVLWNMPSSEDLKFRVIRNPNKLGRIVYTCAKDIVIEISSRNTGYLCSLLMTMAHEMIHVHEVCTGMDRVSEHTAAFHRMARHVCKIHGFDPKLFV
jgi:hypothetical protein